MLLLLPSLLACGADKADADTALDLGPCVDPVISLLAPADGAEVPVGEPVTLEAEAQGRGPFLFLWAVDRDVVARGASASWTPTQAGTFELILQVEDDCGQAQALQTLVVTDGSAAAGR